jgi:hypothetical protein
MSGRVKYWALVDLDKNSGVQVRGLHRGRRSRIMISGCLAIYRYILLLLQEVVMLDEVTDGPK